MGVNDAAFITIPPPDPFSLSPGREERTVRSLF